jgi:hypothetical protein
MATITDLIDVGLTARQADHWTKAGYLRPTWPVEYSGAGARYWRQTLAGAAWDGTVEQLARPVRGRW